MTMVGEWVVEKAFGALYAGVEELIHKNIIFNSLFVEFKSRLDTYKPLILDMVQSNQKLGCPEEELEGLTKVLEDGGNLIDKCKKVRQWNLFKRYKYAKKLLKWEEDVQSHLKLLQIQAIRDGKKMSVAINNIEKMMKAQSLDSITCELPLLPPLPLLTVGLEVPLEKLKTKLLEDDGVSMLVLTAPGGCGKTTLATKFCQDQQVKDKFKDIFFLTVSKKPNLCQMVQQLYRDKDPKNQIIVQNEADASMRLQRFLTEGQNTSLVVLDDVWPGSESLLEKFQVRTPNQKILVTSRSEFPGFSSPYYLPLLDNKNAMELFHHSASLGDKSSCIPEDLSRQIVERCNGFPLAITVVGRSLRGQSIDIWRKRVIEWSKGYSILDDETELLFCLQSSLDALKQDIKECFLDLGSFPEDKRIPTSALIDIWSELYDVDEDTICMANLHELRNRSLVTLVDTGEDKVDSDVYYGEHFTIQHDMLRELAIYNSKEPVLVDDRERLIIDVSGDNIPKWWREQKYQSIKARLVSISTDGQFSVKFPNMQLPEAEVLVLNFQAENYALPEFVANMHKLKVLIITNYGSSPATLSNFQLLGSLSKLKRIRLENISVHSINKSAIQLESVKKVSIVKCNFHQAFRKDSIKMRDVFPKLEELSIDYCYSLLEWPVDLCDLIHLKKLYITHCLYICSTYFGEAALAMEESLEPNIVTLTFPKPKSPNSLTQEIGKLVNLEELRLRYCVDLFKLPVSIRNLKRLRFLDVSYCLNLMELPEHIEEICSLYKISMRACPEMKSLPVSVGNLKQLEQVICDGYTTSLWEPFLPSLRNILVVVDKDSISRGEILLAEMANSTAALARYSADLLKRLEMLKTSKRVIG